MGWQISDYGFGYLRVGDQTFHKDVILLPDGSLVHPWWRREGHRLHLEDLEAVLQARPEVLVIGQGYAGRMVVPAAVRQALEEAGIEVIVEPTPQAWQTFNAMTPRRRAAAALHLTC